MALVVRFAHDAVAKAEKFMARKYRACINIYELSIARELSELETPFYNFRIYFLELFIASSHRILGCRSSRSGIGKALQFIRLRLIARSYRFRLS